jgi:hypothetical protein
MPLLQSRFAELLRAARGYQKAWRTQTNGLRQAQAMMLSGEDPADCLAIALGSMAKWEDSEFADIITTESARFQLTHKRNENDRRKRAHGPSARPPAPSREAPDWLTPPPSHLSQAEIESLRRQAEEPEPTGTFIDLEID